MVATAHSIGSRFERALIDSHGLGITQRQNLTCQRALKTGQDWADQNRPPEVSIALGAARAAQGRDESTHCEPATFNRHVGSQWLVRPKEKPWGQICIVDI